MMQQITLMENPLEVDSWKTYEVEDIRPFLAKHFVVWPETARLYHKQVAKSNDITPASEEDIQRLSTLSGPFFVVVYPQNPLVLLAVIVAVAALVLAIVLKPPMPTVKNKSNSSPNNNLSDRENEVRLNCRIPDIYGTVRSTPDLLTPPYTVYENYKEVEYSLMSIGRGSYDVSDLREDLTPISSLTGVTAEVYAPLNMPLVNTPQIRIGDPILNPVKAAKRYSSVNGQTLLPRTRYKKTNGGIYTKPNIVETDDSDIDWTKMFIPGQQVILGSEGLVDGTYIISTVAPQRITFSNTNWNWSENGGPPTPRTGIDVILEATDYYWVGPFRVGDKTTTEIVLNLVAASGLYKDNGDNQYSTSVTLETRVQPLDENGSNLGQAILNTVTIQGSSTDHNQRGLTVRVPVTSSLNSDPWDVSRSYYAGDYCLYQGIVYYCWGHRNGTPVIGEIPSDIGIEWDSWTPVAPIGQLPSSYNVSVRRITSLNTTFNGQVVDEIQWRDLFAMTDAFARLNYDGTITRLTNLGDITIVRTKTLATESALALKGRKFNCLATRKVPKRCPQLNTMGTWVPNSTYAIGTWWQYNGSAYLSLINNNTHTLNEAQYWEMVLPGHFSVGLVPSRSADDIFCFICNDLYIGNRSATEVDYDNIYDTVHQVVTYFSRSQAGEFSYTFDKDDISFEETLAIIAEAIFCRAYRQGSTIRLSFERRNSDSVLLFNCRNKIPSTETRTINFGYNEDNDGLEYEYVDPTDDAIVTYYIPSDRSAINPKRVESIGVRSYEQAYLHAWRIWNKMKYQNINLSFEATQESDISMVGDRILVSDNTRANTFEGHVEDQNGLELTLSNELPNDPNGTEYDIFLQLYDGTIEAGTLTKTGSYTGTLADAPRLPLSVDSDNYAQATYVLWFDQSYQNPMPFLITEKNPKDNFTTEIKAINYSDLYYQNDQDYP